MITEIWYMMETLRWKMRMPICFAGVGIKNVISWEWNVQFDEKKKTVRWRMRICTNIFCSVCASMITITTSSLNNSRWLKNLIWKYILRCTLSMRVDWLLYRWCERESTNCEIKSRPRHRRWWRVSRGW